MNLDAVQMNNTFAVDQSMMPVHTDNVLEESSISYEAAYSYDELFPSLPENELKLEAPAPDIGQWNQKMKLKTSVITQVFHVPVEERKFRDMNNQRFGEQGEQAKICADIMSKTGAHIEISSSKDQSLTILVTGKEEAVLKARRQILKELQTQATINIQIPKEHHRFIFGKAGKKLKDLELSTATKITVPRPDENSDLIKIVGTKEGIDNAKHEIQLISDEQAKLAFERVKIPKRYHPFILGPFSDMLNSIISETGARVNIPPPTVNKDEITIAGEKEAVALAKERILQIYEEKQKNTQIVSVEVPKNQHRFIIGPRGQTIQEILEETGVSVEMPPSDSQSDTITLLGEQDKLGPALTLVYEKASSVKTDHVDAASWLHKYIIGKKGANIQQIMQNFKEVHVEFADGQDKIKVEGPPAEASQVSAILKQMVHDLLSRLTYEEILIDPTYHRHLIGKNGANIKRIKQDTDVQIHIPTDNENACIRIEGNHEGVAKAKKELLDMAEKIANEVSKELVISQRFHRNIIGARGENIKDIRDRYNQVNITFPEPGLRSDKVILRGPKQDVNACAKYLMQFYDELKINNYIVEVPISKQNLKFIIGKGGANIRKIRDETNTRIDIAENGSSNKDLITITGRKEDATKARDLILDIQQGLDNFVETDIMIPAKLHNSIIGAKGHLVRSIAEDCGGVQIKFPTEHTGSDKVTIRGVKEDVQKAKKMLLDLSNEKQLTSYTEEIKAKSHQHKFLIGKNGVNIKKVRERTGARIIFPNQNDEDRDTITIIGKKEDVLAAKAELLSTISELDKTVESKVLVDPKYHRHFVKSGGEVVKQIVDEFGGSAALSISFPRINTNISEVSVKGLENMVEGAKKRILEIVKDLEQRITIELSIPRKHHRTMMGAKGSKVQSLEQQYNVNIKFPDKETAEEADAEEFPLNGDCHGDETDYNKPPRKCDIILITGREENCNAAKEALKSLVPITKELEVPFDLHRFIIGQKGKDVRYLMETHDVNISIPPQRDASDIIKITGTPSSVDNAVEALKRRIDELEAEKQDRLLRSYQETFDVDPQYHPKIIGRGGAVITKIKQEHNVMINFPDRDTDGDRSNITVIGYQKDVEAAKVAILKIVQEQEDMFRDEVRIDPRAHPRIIGSKGRNISKIMADYHVEIRFPRSNDTEKDLVIISGNEEDVLDAKDHLLNLEEECLQEISEQEFMKTYTHPPSRYSNSHDNDNSRPKEFVVTGAPWDKKKSAPDTTNTEEFPSFGASGEMPSKPVAWGPSRR